MERMKELINILNKASYEYYQNDSSKLSKSDRSHVVL